MKAKIFTLLLALAAALPSCTRLNSGESFNQTVGGIEYNFEVIVSKIAYVRLTPVSDPSVVKGDITLPTTAEYDGVTYTVTQIGQQAFRDYTGITSVILPRTLSQIENEAFAGCTSLRAINTPQPLSVIGEYAFDGCSALKAVSLEASISELGRGAFRGCASLEELAFTPTITEIPDELFSGCTGLKEIRLPSTIMHVGASAFEGCASARSIKIDRSLQEMGARAFSGCFAVESVSCMTATPPVCSADTFDGIPAGIPVTVPMANVDDYRYSSGWNRFSNYIGKY